MIRLAPWLWCPPQVAHKMAPHGIKLLGSLFGKDKPDTWRPLVWKNLHFPNRLGIAGGVDKDGYNVMDWHRLGAGFVEVGTITPRPQEPNPGVTMDRRASLSMLWNKMGFPNQGAEACRQRLQSLGHNRPIIFLNAGKNRETPNEDSAEDYLQVIRSNFDCADVFVLNISSPNTEGLRQLLQPANLKPFLSEILLNAPTTKPYLLKLSPDMTDQELLSSLEIGTELGLSGFILTNTLANNQNLFPNHQGGGVSGAPLKEKSVYFLKKAKEHLDRLGSDGILISVGGVLTPEDVFARLDAGATLVQTYSALVFDGPFFFQKVGRRGQWH